VRLYGAFHAADILAFSFLRIIFIIHFKSFLDRYDSL